MSGVSSAGNTVTLFGGDYEHVLAMSQIVDDVTVDYHTAPPADIRAMSVPRKS